MKILVTGGTGFLGQALVRRLLSQGHRVYLVARSLEKAQHTVAGLRSDAADRCVLITGDITLPGLGLDQGSLELLKGEVDLVIHAAACIRFAEAARDELLKINYLGTKRVLELARNVGAGRFMYVSTAYTVGRRPEAIESLYPVESFNNPYEETKCMAERLVFSSRDHLSVSIYRPTVIIGDSRTGEADSTLGLYGFMRLVERFRKRLAKRSPGYRSSTLRIIGEREASINLIPVDYVVDVLEAGVEYGRNCTIYNIVNPNPPSMEEAIIKLACPRVGLSNVRFVSPSEDLSLSSEETTLNRWVAPFFSYLNQSKVFVDENTRALLAQVRQESLRLNFEGLRYIIDHYQGVDDQEASA